MVEVFESAVPAEKSRPLRRQEYDHLVAGGAFAEERLELLEGRIIPMSPQGPHHAAVIRRLTMILVPALAEQADVQIQSPLAISDVSEPEPDLAVVDKGEYLEDHPRTAHLVIEVADTSQHRDRQVKGPLYASAGIPEYWVVDLAEEIVEVYTGPAATTYRSKTSYGRGDEIQLQRHPEVTLRVDDFLLPRKG